tara:strand:+ start:40 stop:708 length:669 start_codon:yes stop_codon:yes gene_type:complete
MDHTTLQEWISFITGNDTNQKSCKQFAKGDSGEGLGVNCNDIVIADSILNDVHSKEEMTKILIRIGWSLKDNGYVLLGYPIKNFFLYLKENNLITYPMTDGIRGGNMSAGKKKPSYKQELAALIIHEVLVENYRTTGRYGVARKVLEQAKLKKDWPKEMDFLTAYQKNPKQRQTARVLQSLKTNATDATDWIEQYLHESFDTVRQLHVDGIGAVYQLKDPIF